MKMLKIRLALSIRGLLMTRYNKNEDEEIMLVKICPKLLVYIIVRQNMSLLSIKKPKKFIFA